MKKITQIIQSIKKYLLRDTQYFFLYCYRYLQHSYRQNAHFYSEKELSNLLKNGKSLIRMGDGEIGLLHFLPIHYQIFSDAIRKDFLKIVRTYTNNSSYILMIPLFVNTTNEELKKMNRFHVWMPLKVTYELIFHKNATYFDQHIFYKDNKFRDLVLPAIAQKKIIVVTHKKNIEDIYETDFAKKVLAFIECPKENAYEARNNIKNNIIQKITELGLQRSQVVIIMAAGLAKTIIFDMSQDGYQLLDVGKGFEAYYKNISLESEI